HGVHVSSHLDRLSLVRRGASCLYLDCAHIHHLKLLITKRPHILWSAVDESGLAFYLRMPEFRPRESISVPVGIIIGGKGGNRGQSGWRQFKLVSNGNRHGCTSSQQCNTGGARRARGLVSDVTERPPARPFFVGAMPCIAPRLLGFTGLSSTNSGCL